MLTAVIIDDEKSARDSLKDDLRNYCKEVKVTGEAPGVSSGIALITDLKPDLVFLDIEMADGNGFDLLEKLENAAEFNLIFTTSHDEFAIKAIRFSALDYLLKPIDTDELVAAVSRARKKNEKINRDMSLQLLLETVSLRKTNSIPKIALASADSITVYKIDSILRCESQRNYTLFHFVSEKPLLVSKTLREFEDLLKEYSFVRVHHSHLVNMNKVKKFVKSDGGYLLMEDNASVPVAQSKKEQVLQMLSDL